MVVPPARSAGMDESNDQESDADEAYEDAGMNVESSQTEAPRRSNRSRGLSDKFRYITAQLKSEDADSDWYYG